MEVLCVSGLTKRYDSFTLDNAAFAVRQGEIHGLIGRNGAGKSTTLNCLTGLAAADAGSISFFGLPLVGNELAIRQRMAFMCGGVDYYLNKKLKVITQVTASFYPSWDDALYRRYMTDFDLDENKTPAMLSAGMRVKYSLALAMSRHAELLILDEPTSGLDPISRDELIEVFIRLQQEGASILFSTHITSDLEKCADSITYIRKGQIRQTSSLADFTSSYRLVTLTDENRIDAFRPYLIGLKQGKSASTALMLPEDAVRLGIDASQPTLEDVMIHLEKEDAQ